ncbi:MAG TPA: adenylate/guanylate cyclase domain-containing protein, partial [Gammaproteobacteria bacterium]
MSAKAYRKNLRQKLLPIIGSLVISVLVLGLQQADSGLARALRDRLDWLVYDLRLNQTLPEKPEGRPDVSIVDIDEASLNAEGQWPWPRARLADLIDRLVEYGVIVVAFDVVFAEPEENIALQALREITPVLGDAAAPAAELLEQAAEAVDGDLRFASSIAAAVEAGTEIVLGYTMSHEPNATGVPGPPLELDAGGAVEELTLFDMNGYTGNIELLQQAAGQAGYFVATPDSDGVNRRYPMILRFNGEIYPSLALAAANRFLFTEQTALRTALIGSSRSIEAITLDGLPIPTDGAGFVLIPYRGPGKTFRYVSATDVLHGTADPAALEGRIALIGATAAGLLDVRSTPVQSVFPGVEIHANVIGGIIDQHFPHRPTWAEGADFLLTLGAGLVLSLLLPFLSVVSLVLIGVVASAGVIWLNLWLWIERSFDTSLVGPLYIVIGVAGFNLVYGFFTETRQRRQLKDMFGQYVPPQLVDRMSDNPEGISDRGERREMTVLFCDIRSFTTISEQLEANELADMLNRFFTPMTEIIFNHDGTIDKYVGDMIMAFWNAPLDDPQHATHAIETALEMLEQVEALKPEFKQLGYPECNIGIGLNTGPMNVGNMGSKFRRAYTVLGDSVNLGSRLEGLTKFYGVKLIVGETTREGQDEHFVFRQLDRVTVKGKKEPTRIYTPLCRRDRASPELLAELDAYTQARAHYIGQRWDEAAAEFGALQQAHPETYIYGLYLERVAHLREVPPGADWDGV